jgi:L-malate glycosyltransferase
MMPHGTPTSIGIPRTDGMNVLMLGPAGTVHLHNLARGLADRGCRIHVISKTPDQVPGAEFELFKVPSFGIRHPVRWEDRWRRYMCDLFRRFDVVHVHFLDDWRITEDVACCGRLIVQPYGSDVDHPPDTDPPDPKLVDARQTLVRCADATVVPSRFFRGRVARFADVSVDSIDVFRHDVDASAFTPRGSRRDQSPVVGYFKGFRPVYGPEVLIDAIPQVLERRPDVRFELVGDGRTLDACRRQVERLEIGHAVTWFDRLPHEQMPQMLSRWDIVAIPSRKESFCVAALEAAAMEIPVVASRVGGLCESVRHGETGLLVEPGDPKALADGILDLVRHPHRRRAMGRFARRWVIDHHAPDDYLDWCLKLYSRVCEKKPRRRRLGRRLSFA